MRIRQQRLMAQPSNRPPLQPVTSTDSKLLPHAVLLVLLTIRKTRKKGMILHPSVRSGACGLLCRVAHHQ